MIAAKVHEATLKMRGFDETRMALREVSGKAPHGIRAGAQGAVILDVFAPPRDEYREAGKGFGGG